MSEALVLEDSLTYLYFSFKFGLQLRHCIHFGIDIACPALVLTNDRIRRTLLFDLHFEMRSVKRSPLEAIAV